MIYRQVLLDAAEAYLKSLVREELGSSADFDSTTPFGELGVDSFRVLKIIKALETDFGVLPKTLLFENFNIADLAGYFADNHAKVLETKVAAEPRPPAPHASDRARIRAAVVEAAATGAATVGEATVGEAGAYPTAAEPAAEPVARSAQPILILEKDAHAHPQLGELVRDLFERFKNDGSVSRGTRTIAPNLFIGAARKGYFHYARSNNILLAYTYTGPVEYFPEVAAELHAHCERNGLELNLIAVDPLESVGGARFSSTPFGVLQRMVDLPAFTLEGQSMRRLRYLVNKFRKSGSCRTVEFRCGEDGETSRQIAAMIDAWSASRTMVNPLIGIVKEEILAATLHPDHRIFLTYLDDVLQNVILISPMAAEQGGYLMDLEFYHPEMPLGGLELAIVNIVETLVAEGFRVLSLGGTYGCKLESSANADPQIDEILDDLRRQNIFNDEGNLQFKNKFRPVNRTIYLCRAVGSCDPHNVIDVIMMVADPLRLQTSDAEHHNAGIELGGREPGVGVAGADEIAVDGLAAGQFAIGERSSGTGESAGGGSLPSNAVIGIDGLARSFVLARHGFNPLNVPREHVDIDLKTDSWAQLATAAIDHQLRHLHAQLHTPADLERALADIFPFSHFVLTSSGRAAERVLYRSWGANGTVPQNLLFPTTIFHQIDNGFAPLELPSPQVFELASSELYKGRIDLEALRRLLETDAARVALACVELANNAAGGYPLPVAHLRELKALLGAHGIPLVLDATRVLDNAWFLVQYDSSHTGRSVWDVARELMSEADAAVVSLAKNFCVNAGGLIATDDPDLYDRTQRLALADGCALGAIDRRLVALALEDRGYIEAQTERRQASVTRLWSALRASGVPLVEPAGGHCVLIDAKRVPELAGLAHPAASLAAWLYLATGIRAAVHNAGMQQRTALNELVRLAIPVGTKPREIDDIAARIAAAFAARQDIPELEVARSAQRTIGDIHLEYRLARYRNASAPLVPEPPADDAARSPAHAPGKPAPPAAAAAASTDIAVIGMAGRYPKARNLRELWANLTDGVSSIEEIPQERLELRGQGELGKRYPGGFIDGVDRFDAGFFGISAHDAKIMDPQERLFLEVAYEALEDAGYHPESLPGGDPARNVGVFVGAVWSAYQLFGVEQKMLGNDVNPSSFFWSIANRVSHWMNFRGPSLTLDTACSAGLAAIKLACDAIRNGECTAAVVGAVNLDLHQSKLDINSTASAISADGVCRSFGKGANGYVSGEGVGALLLKPLAQAVADGDQIHGVIKSAVVAHSGKTSAYTVPLPQPQARLIVRALEEARVDARHIGYVEGHGTGTQFGDAIEVAGLVAAFEPHGVAPGSCALGSIKPNIGHLEAASGIVGLQKVLLQMRHATLVPSLHCAEPNENIDFARSPFYVPQTVEPWPVKKVDGVHCPRRAGVSAIGAGGTAAHVIVEQYERPVPPAPRPAAQPAIFPLSARTEDDLEAAAVRLRAFLGGGAAADLHAYDIAYTLLYGRKSFRHRVAIVARSKEELAEKLAAFLDGRADDDVNVGHVGNADAIVGLLKGKERQDFVELLAQSGDARRLARLWSDGVIDDWQGIGLGIEGRRVSLPTYPFAGARYWIVDGAAARPPTPVPAPTPAQTEHECGAAAADQPAPRREPGRGAVRYAFAVSDEHDAAAQTASTETAEDKAFMLARQLLADRLALPAEALTADVSLMETGVTSLDLVAMTQALKTQLDPAFSPTAFFECATLGTFAAALSHKYAAVFERIRVIATPVAEAAGPASGEPPRLSAPPAAAGAPHLIDAASELPVPELDAASAAEALTMRCVLLTGATGFLGIHVLAELLECDPDVRVYCLVRAQDAERGLVRVLARAKAFELALDPTRIRIVCGDIHEPRLGLSELDWRDCCTDVDQIVHAAAHVNHIEGYATFRASVRGMKEIIRIASVRKPKLIHFISSTAACAHKVGEEFSIFEKEEFVPDGERVYGGYGRSKWVQERLLERGRALGVPFAIYRFGELSGSSKTGLGQLDDMLHRLLQMRLAVDCREKITSDVLDMLPVDLAARLIAGVGTRPELWNDIVHATHPRPCGIAAFYRRAESCGLAFAPVTRERYLAKCYDFVKYTYSIAPVNAFVLECALRDAEGSMRKRKIMDGYFAVLFPFAQDKFERALATLGLTLPSWDALLDRYFSRWSEEERGFLARVLDYRRWSAAEALTVAEPDTAAPAEPGSAVLAAAAGPAAHATSEDRARHAFEARPLETFSEA